MGHCRGIRTVAWGLVLALWVFACPAAAFPAGDAARSGPYLLTADRIIYNQQENTVSAQGKAELSNAEYVLGARSLFYDENKDLVTAHDDFWLIQPDRSVLFAQKGMMASDFTQGFAERAAMLMADNTRFAALRARRINGRYTLFDKGVFSPCDLCASNPRKPPLWQMKARRVTHDQEARDLIYRDATMEMWGFPVFHTPYFSHPDPTVKRRSGFLTPAAGNSSTIGTFAIIPYYYTFSPDFDITFRPQFSSVDGFRWHDTLRKRFERGEVELTTSLVIADRTDDDAVTKKDQIRGHMRGFARFALDPVFRAGAEFALLTDKSYAKRYSEPLEDILTNRVYLEGMKGRDFGAVEFFYFQNNRAGATAEEPVVLPRLRYSALGEPAQFLGGRWSFDGMAASLMRDTGASTRKLGLEFGWQRRGVADGGLVTEINALVRDDLFWIDNQPDEFTPTIIYNDRVTHRVFPTAQLALRYPLAKPYDGFSHVFEPIVSLTAAPRHDRDPFVPNEDSQDVEFDATNLFAINRYPGADRQEQGVRAAYGLRNAFYFDNGGTAEILFGQGYRLTDDPLFPAGSGLDTRFSDFVGEALLDPAPWLHFDYLFRLDQKGLESRKHDINTSFGVPEFRPWLAYTFLNEPVTAAGAVGKVEELRYGFSSRFTEYWTLSATQTRDLRTSDSALRTMSVGLAYRDECLAASLNFSRDFTQQADVKTGDTVFFTLYFKHLGGIDSGPRAF